MSEKMAVNCRHCPMKFETLRDMAYHAMWFHVGVQEWQLKRQT